MVHFTKSYTKLFSLPPFSNNNQMGRNYLMHEVFQGNHCTWLEIIEQNLLFLGVLLNVKVYMISYLWPFFFDSKIFIFIIINKISSQRNSVPLTKILYDKNK